MIRFQTTTPTHVQLIHCSPEGIHPPLLPLWKSFGAKHWLCSLYLVQLAYWSNSHTNRLLTLTCFPLSTEWKLNLHETFRRTRLGFLLNVLGKLNLCPVSRALSRLRVLSTKFSFSKWNFWFLHHFQIRHCQAWDIVNQKHEHGGIIHLRGSLPGTEAYSSVKHLRSRVKRH